MPEIVPKVYGYHIYFWSNEGEPVEPIHFHISKEPHKNATKVTLRMVEKFVREGCSSLIFVCVIK